MRVDIELSDALTARIAKVRGQVLRWKERGAKGAYARGLAQLRELRGRSRQGRSAVRAGQFRSPPP